MNVKTIINKVKSTFKKMFSKHFISPEVNKEIATAIDDKIIRRNLSQQIINEQQQKVLNSYVYTFFSKKYDNKEDWQIAFNITNRKWKLYASEFNSKNKLINLDKNGFKRMVTEVLLKTKENGKK